MYFTFSKVQLNVIIYLKFRNNFIKINQMQYMYENNV